MKPLEDNKLTLNTNKTKEMRVDTTKNRRTHQLLFIQGLVVYISEDLTWTLTTQLVKKAEQGLYFLR